MEALGEALARARLGHNNSRNRRRRQRQGKRSPARGHRWASDRRWPRPKRATVAAAEGPRPRLQSQSERRKWHLQWLAGGTGADEKARASGGGPPKADLGPLRRREAAVATIGQTEPARVRARARRSLRPRRLPGRVGAPAAGRRGSEKDDRGGPRRRRQLAKAATPPRPGNPRDALTLVQRVRRLFGGTDGTRGGAVGGGGPLLTVGDRRRWLEAAMEQYKEPCLYLGSSNSNSSSRRWLRRRAAATARPGSVVSGRAPSR